MNRSSNRAAQPSSPKSARPIGAFFTPIAWAEWAVTKSGVYQSWLDGAVICDPTAGTGSFLEALIGLALKNGLLVSKEMIQRLRGVEREEAFVSQFFDRIQTRYGISFPRSSFLVGDILFMERFFKADILVGNPPWQNFADLPDDYKEKTKPLFHKYDLVRDPKKLLLGDSRIDIAALVIAKTIQDDLNESGDAFFFMPLSILLNEGAHKGLRSYRLNSTEFAIEGVWDFKDYPVFESISTRYGFVHFKRDQLQVFPVPYAQWERGEWVHKKALPLADRDGPLAIVASDIEARRLVSLRKIDLPEGSKPRQGVNTCGANGVFIFEGIESERDGLCLTVTSKNEKVWLPAPFLHPLITKENFAEKHPTPRRFILLPYDREKGKPLSMEELQSHPELWRYLAGKKEILQKRRGILINKWIRKGIWWTLLGVGPYSFARFKIAWEAYGRGRFSPKIFEEGNLGVWQGNQAMHAYVPLTSRSEAERVLSELRAEGIQDYLMSFQMEGTRSWAQPGRMKRLFNLVPNRKRRTFVRR